MFLAFEKRFLSAFSSGQNHQVPKPPKCISSCTVGDILMCAEAALPHPTGALPFSPRKGKRKGKLPKRGRRGQETRLPPDVWLEVWFVWEGARPTPMVQGGARWSLGRAKVTVHISSVRARCRPRAPSPGASPKKSERTKSRPKIPLRHLYAKSSQTMVFEFAAGFENFCRRR